MCCGQKNGPIQVLVGWPLIRLKHRAQDTAGENQPTNQVVSGSFRKGNSDSSPQKKRQGELEPLRADEGLNMSS